MSTRVCLDKHDRQIFHILGSYHIWILLQNGESFRLSVTVEYQQLLPFLPGGHATCGVKMAKTVVVGGGQVVPSTTRGSEMRVQLRFPQQPSTAHNDDETLDSPETF